MISLIISILILLPVNLIASKIIQTNLQRTKKLDCILNSLILLSDIKIEPYKT